MATTTFCDWCGELIEGTGRNREPLAITVSGDSPLGFMHRSVLAGGFNIHAEAIYGREIDPDCCLGQLEKLLRERADWAHDQDQESHEWRLVPRGGRRLTAREEREEGRAEREDARRRWESSTREEREEMIRARLTDSRLTIREIGEALEEEFPDMRIYESHVRPVVSRMLAAGELTREGEQWRAGDGPGSTRYRYALADEAAV